MDTCFSVGEIESLQSGADGLQLSRRARERLSWLRHYALTDSVTDTCRYYRIPRVTLYRLLRRFDPLEPSTLEDRSRRPHTARELAPPGAAASAERMPRAPMHAATPVRPTGPRGACFHCRLLAGDRRSVRHAILVCVLVNAVLVGVLVQGLIASPGRAAPPGQSRINETTVSPMSP
jgi:hypothetical protein